MLYYFSTQIVKNDSARCVGLQYILDTEEKRMEGYGCFCYS